MTTKAKLFHLYAGQKHQWHEMSPIMTLSSSDLVRMEYYKKETENYCLSLRPIAGLTDEEAIKLASIVIEEPFDRYRRLTVTRDKRGEYDYITVSHKNVRYRFCIDCFFVNFAVYDMEDTISGEIDMKPYACIDYLRSIGIALPFTTLEDGVVKTYTVSDMVDLNWIKLND